jgi:hypothetical protein
MLLDGIEVGQIAEGEVLNLEIEAGEHEIEARIDWCSSRPLRFQVESSHQTILVRSALRGLRLPLALFYVLFFSGEYLELDLIE